jgi:acyl-CoA thioesterase-1
MLPAMERRQFFLAITPTVIGAAQVTQENPAFTQVEDKPGLPRVLLIGDSISIGYTVPVRKRVAGKVNLHRIPENGGPTIKGLEKIDEWLGDGRWDLIHFNWGLHDLKLMDGKHQVPLPAYEENLDTLVERMKQTGAKLIWANTTPVPEGKVNPPRKPSDVPAYNGAAARVMGAHGAPTNDLYSFALPRLKEIQRPVNVHFTESGSDALGEVVAARILAALDR